MGRKRHGCRVTTPAHHHLRAPKASPDCDRGDKGACAVCRSRREHTDQQRSNPVDHRRAPLRWTERHACIEGALTCRWKLWHASQITTKGNRRSVWLASGGSKRVNHGFNFRKQVFSHRFSRLDLHFEFASYRGTNYHRKTTQEAPTIATDG